jgi:hypothetical protein
VVALLAGAFLSHAAALPGGFGRGGFRGTPHEVPNSARGVHGAGEPFFGGNRIADPDIFLTVEEQFRRVQEREAVATGVPHDAAPWPDTPHLRVRLTGDPQKDAMLIGRLERELGRPLGPARMRVASLVDDAATDAVLDAGLPGEARVAGRAFERRVRLTPDVLDEGRLGALLEGHRGEVLLLIAHIDAQRQAIVFRDAKGGERLIGLQDLAQAELRAGVQVVLIGCHSSRFRAPGFVDSLNSLDAVAAVVRAVGGKPTNYRELFGRLAGPQLEMLIDPQRFEALGEADFVRPGSDVPVSTLRWSDAPGGVAISPANGSTPVPDAPGGPDSGLGVARASIAGIALLSWLAGVAIGWRRWSGHAARWGAALASVVWHAAALIVLCGAFAEAATDGTAATIGVVSALVAVPVALGLLVRAIDHHSHWIAFHAVNLVRAVAASLPFFLVATLFALGRSGLPEPARAALLAVYHAVRDAPAFELAIGLAFVMVWVHYELERAIGAAARRRVQLAKARIELQSIGVSRPANLAAALGSMCAFLKAMHKHDLGDPQDSRAEPLVEAVAPDPWTDGLPRRFALVKLRVAHTPVLGLTRTGTAFVHPIPEALADEWREGRVGAGAMPRLLALIEPRLRVRDYLELPRRNARRLAPFVDRMIAAAALLSAFAAVGIEIWLPDELRDDVYLWIAAAALSGPLLIGCTFGWQLRWMLYDRLLLRRLRAASGVVGLAGAARDKGLR